MSNLTRKTRKGERSPAVRKDELNAYLNQIDQKMQQLQQLTINAIYAAQGNSAGLGNLINYLIENKVIDKNAYQAYLDEIKRKSKRAQEIQKDKDLSQEEKIAIAKTEDIPVEWVKENNKDDEQEISEEEEEESKIITPDSKIIIP